MSDFKTELGFEDCWTPPKPRKTGGASVGSFGRSKSKEPKAERGAVSPSAPRSQAGGSAKTISTADKAKLARIVRRVPEVVVKVSRPAKNDKRGNPIKVSRATEATRVGEHLAYISRNGKIEVENDRGEKFDGRQEVAAIYREWMDKHDEDRREGAASDRTRITTSIVFSMPGTASPEGVKDAVRALAAQEFKGRHDYVMALHTDTHHPHVHLSVRTVGQDGVKLNLRKADLQHLRETFAEKLRQRGIEAEATPRHARGVTRKGEDIAVYKIRQRGGKPYIDAKKRREVQRDLDGNGGRLPQRPWDDGLVGRRSRVMATYGNAARILESSVDPADRALAGQVRQYTARLTDVTTQRAAMAQSMEGRVRADKNDRPQRSETAMRSRERDQDRTTPTERGRGPER